MKIIVKPRCSGKTTELIKLSAETRYHIVCRHAAEARGVCSIAHEMNLVIPAPVTWADILNHALGGRRDITGLLIDNADDFLRHIVGEHPVEAITLTND